ncbi:hypothetical protein [Gilliamella sp. Pas-s25]|nr:hypothetical protein [Gilliamella sp. Pas-s25]
MNSERYNWEEYTKNSYEVAKKAIEYSKESSRKVEEARRKSINTY